MLDALTGAAGVGVRALVLDSGVEPTHPELLGRKINCFRVATQSDGIRRVIPDEGGVTTCSTD